MITYFKSINDTDKPFYVDIDVAIDRIKFGKSKDIVKKILKSITIFILGARSLAN